MNRKTVQFLFDCIAFYDLNPESGTLYRVITCTLFLTFGIIQTIIYAFRNTDNLYKFILTISNLLVAVTFLSTLVSFLRHNKEVQALLKYIDQHIYTYSDEPIIRPSYTRLESEDNILQIFSYICKCNAFLVTCVALPPWIQLIILGKVEATIYPSWIPWQINGIISFFCAYLTNLSVLLTGYFTFNVYLIFPLFVTLEFRRQRKRLCTALHGLEKRTEEHIRANERKRKKCTNSVFKLSNHEIIRRNVIDCIKHHQMLLK